MAAQVLESGTYYATALHMNIHAFYRAICTAAEHTSLQDQIHSMQSEILELKKKNENLSKEVLLMKKLLSDGEEDTKTGAA